jgi:hypothetical protein
MKNEIELPSNRNFGQVFGTAFLILSWYIFEKEQSMLAILALLVGLLILVLAFLIPDSLKSLNRLWMKVGEILGRIISPIVMGVIFFLIFTPLAVIMRIFGRDELRLKKGVEDSYWRDRSPTGPEPSSFKQQF